MLEKFRQKSFPRFNLRARLDEYYNSRNKRYWDDDTEFLGRSGARTIFDFYPFSVLKEMHSFLFFKVSLVFSLALLTFFLSLINLPFSHTLLKNIHYVTTWKTDFIALGKQAAPVVKSLWEGSPERYLDVWAPIVGRNDEEGSTNCFSMPFAGRVVKNFGYGYNPKLQREDLTYGLLFSAPGGGEILAAASGKVSEIKNDPYYGLLIVLRHDGGMETCYGYLGETLVAEGEEVTCGEQIARIGLDAETQVSYLYFEARDKGRPFDPLPLFTAPGGS